MRGRFFRIKDLHQKSLQAKKIIGAILGPLFEPEICSKVWPSLSVPNDWLMFSMKTKILLVLLLESAERVQADRFKVHSFSIRGSGKDIIVNANSSDDARYQTRLSQESGAQGETRMFWIYLLAVLLCAASPGKPSQASAWVSGFRLCWRIAGSFVGL